MRTEPSGLDRRPARRLRERCRTGEFAGHTSGQAPGFVQANLVVLPKELAFDFLLFCQRNPKPCPLLDVTDAGDPVPRGVAPNADLRTDLPRYRVYRHGVLTDEPTDIRGLWSDDLVAFLLGCSFTFESALEAAGLPVRHLHEVAANGLPKNVPMYETNLQCRSAGVFHGPSVVSMRPYKPAQAVLATQITAAFPRAHGAPIHIGDPATLGIRDIDKPEFGDAVEIRPGEVPVFWACGVTPQAALMRTKPPFAITHAPGHMFVCDLTNSELQLETPLRVAD